MDRANGSRPEIQKSCKSSSAPTSFSCTKRFGDGKQKTFIIYDNPHKQTIENGIEVFEWDFVGDMLYEIKSDLKEAPLAKDNYRNTRFVVRLYRATPTLT